MASGGLAAVGSYVGVIWKLSSRVTKLEETVVGLTKEQAELKKQQSEDKKEYLGKMGDIHTRQETAKREIITSIGILQKEMADFRVTCSDNRGAMVRKKEFNIFTDEQERRWSEFYRLVGRLEGVMDRLSRHPPALTKNSSNS